MTSLRNRIVELTPNLETRIAPVAAGVLKPSLSVVLPVYEPDELLIEALNSVLRQDLGPGKMQIAVVDDASHASDVADLVSRTIAPERVELYRVSSNQGLAGNWNQCVRIALGEILHLLHQDDWIEPGFYQRLSQAFSKSPSIGMAFCRYAIVDGNGEIVSIPHRERFRAGILPYWLERIVERQRIQCASVMVRRRVYEQLGGYRPELCYALDWEMWVRIAAHFDVWYEPRKLACYRRHGRSETDRLTNVDETDWDLLRAIDLFAECLPKRDRTRLVDTAYAFFVRRRLKQFAKSTITERQVLGAALKPLRTAASRIAGSPSSARRLQNQIARTEAGIRRQAREEPPGGSPRGSRAGR